jgi:KDO2-lipid IV(A) lauroyltransferase
MSHSLLSYCAFRLMGGLAPLLPPRLGYWLAEQAGSVAYHLGLPSPTALRGNLYHVLGTDGDDNNVEHVALDVFRNLAKNYYDLFHKHALSIEEATSSIEVRGLHHIEEGLRNGRGLIVASAHFGPFDAVWLIGRRLDLNITAPAEHIKPERLYRYVCKLRDKEWITLLPVDRPLMGLVRALRRGELVAIGADRDITGSGIVVDFFGAPATLPDGAVQLALRTGASLLTCFAVRQPDNTAVLEVEPALHLESTGDFERDVLVNVRKVAARMEDWIGRYPGQWLVLYPIWEDGRYGE